jgi:hypothetical protein
MITKIVDEWKWEHLNITQLKYEIYNQISNSTSAGNYECLAHNKSNVFRRRAFVDINCQRVRVVKE